MSSPLPLEFRPCAGLANRLRALASALCAAEDLRRPLRIWWPIEPGICSAPFSALFETAGLPEWVILQESWAPHSHEEKLLRKQEEWDKLAANASTILPLRFKSYSHFYTRDPARWTSWLRRLHPLPQHRTAVQIALAGAHGARPIGIHMRRTDHTKCAATSPLSLFVAAAEERLANHPGATFFVATDDDAERRRFRAALPAETRIVCLATALDRVSVAGGAQAFQDFLALSQCAEIWGSAGSSFSEVAAAYGGVPYRAISLDT